MDNNPKANPADVFIAGKTTEDVLRAMLAGNAPDGTLKALVERFDPAAEEPAGSPVGAGKVGRPAAVRVPAGL